MKNEKLSEGTIGRYIKEVKTIGTDAVVLVNEISGFPAQGAF
tara:strand:- start:65111 stop:65236 length:126 start_codon:yes stop_codon:yes gene_type:complete